MATTPPVPNVGSRSSGVAPTPAGATAAHITHTANTVRSIDALITSVARADRIAKGSLHGDAWVELEGLVARIAGVRLAA